MTGHEHWYIRARVGVTQLTHSLRQTDRKELRQVTAKAFRARPSPGRAGRGAAPHCPVSRIVLSFYSSYALRNKESSCLPLSLLATSVYVGTLSRFVMTDTVLVCSGSARNKTERESHLDNNISS